MDIRTITSQAWDLVHMPGFVEAFITKATHSIAPLIPGIRFNFELMHGDRFVSLLDNRSKNATPEQYIRLEYGKSFYDVQAFRFHEGFSFTRINGRVNVNATFHRTNPSENGLYEFLFPHPDTDLGINIAGGIKVLGKNAAEGGIWASPGIDFDLCPDKGCELRFISIVIDRDMITRFLTFDQRDMIHTLIIENNEFIFFEKSGSAINTYLRQLFAHCKYDLAGMIQLEALTKLMIAAFLQQLLDRKANRRPVRLNTPQMDRALKAKKFIHANLSRKLVLAQLARRLGTNRVTLQKEFQALFGVSVYQYYLNSRLEKAKELLESGQFNVAEVSSRLGYPNPSQLSKSFTKKFGKNPVSFIP